MNSSNRSLFPGLSCALCVALAAGCVHSPQAFQTASAPGTVPPLSARVMSSLFAAEVDEAPDEIVEFYEHEEEFKPRPAPRFPVGPSSGPRARRPRPRTAKSNRFGVRCGYFTPGESDYGWPDAWYVGLFVRRAPKKPHKMSAEFGGEFVKLEAPDGSVFTRMYILHADLLLGRMGAEGLAAYALVGAQLITEEADLYSQRDRAAFGGGIEIGGGVGSGDGRWEIRAVYTEIMSSGRNAEDVFSVSFGFAF